MKRQKQKPITKTGKHERGGGDILSNSGYSEVLADLSG
jgi:hypothetical protein